jgi:glycosyltransferase involved in cell wall biosynthesis
VNAETPRLVVDVQATQSPGFSERGIARFVREVATNLIRRGAAARLIVNPDLPEPVGFPPDVRLARLFRSMDDDILGELTGPLAWFCGSPFDSFAVGRRVLPPQVLKSGIPIVAPLYDLIPLANPAAYLGNPVERRAYEIRCELLRWADLVPCISRYGRAEAVALLGLDPLRLPVVYAGVSEAFRPGPTSSAFRRLADAIPAIRGPFVLTVSAADPRKNLEALIDAWATIGLHHRRSQQLVVICSLPDTRLQALQAHAEQAGVAAGEIVWAGKVDDAVLVAAYRSCHLFVLASLQEGFGLPVAEALACGAPAVCSSTTSLPEILDLPEACFDPSNPEDIARVMRLALDDTAFTDRLRARGEERRDLFTWPSTVDRLLSSLDGLVPRQVTRAGPSA